MKKRKGFTLIELMIVLAIIAILALVIVPKAGIFKKNAKTAGVTTNVNTVRAYLETKTADNFKTAADLATAMKANFPTTTDEAIVNPFNKIDTIGEANPESAAAANGVIVIKAGGEVALTEANCIGSVIVVVDETAGSESYTVYGIGGDGAKTGKDYVIK